jgi:hypothetical protein
VTAVQLPAALVTQQAAAAVAMAVAQHHWRRLCYGMVAVLRSNLQVRPQMQLTGASHAACKMTRLGVCASLSAVWMGQRWFAHQSADLESQTLLLGLLHCRCSAYEQAACEPGAGGVSHHVPHVPHWRTPPDRTGKVRASCNSLCTITQSQAQTSLLHMLLPLPLYTQAEKERFACATWVRPCHAVMMLRLATVSAGVPRA